MIITDTNRKQFDCIVWEIRMDNADRAFWLKSKAEEERQKEEWQKFLNLHFFR